MTLRRINSETYHNNTSRYKLVAGTTKDAPLCPFGNSYKWIGYDNHENEFVRFTKSVFKKLIAQKN
jgi:hypothetical protein